MAYSFYYPPENKVFLARNAKFFENSLIIQESSGSLEDLEIIQEEDLMCLNNKADKYELGDLNEPANYKVALSDPEFDKWLKAINVEKKSMKDKEVWDLVDLLPNGKNDVKSYLGRCFALKDLGEAAYILGIKIYRDRSKRNLTDADDLKSQTGYVFILNGGAIDWKSTKQSIFAHSFAEAEYIAASNASKEADVKSYLGRCFALKDLGEAAYILGIKIYRDRSKRLIEKILHGELQMWTYPHARKT
nr:hypothetical protein [Tanacetum cinerariifolium]